MAKAKKTKKVEEVKVDEVSQQLEPIGEIKLTQESYEDCEWCFQFDEDEPQVFAWTDELLNQSEEPKVIFTVTNGKNSFISFSKENKTFKIFARELSEIGKDLREKQRASFKTLENGSENKEA
jgi:hypothetical protein